MTAWPLSPLEGVRQLSWTDRLLGELSPSAALMVEALGFGTLAAMLAVAFVLGGFWALRGRAALRIPACSGCKALLKGAGSDLPACCSECGRTLDRPRSVLWLRFRRQPTTVLVTSPVVLLGGTTLAVFAAAMPIMAFDRAHETARVAKRRVQEAVIRAQMASSPGAAMTASPSDEADRVAFEAIADLPLGELADRFWKGGDEGTAALLRLCVWSEGQRSRVRLERPADLEKVTRWIEELAEGRRPETPLSTPERGSFSFERARAIADAGVDGPHAAALHILAGLWATPAGPPEPGVQLGAERVPAVDLGRLRALGDRLLRPAELSVPARVGPHASFVATVRTPGFAGQVTARIRRVAIDGREVWPADVETLPSQSVELVGPAALGEHRLEITSQVTLPRTAPYSGETGPAGPWYAKIEHTDVRTLVISAGPEVVPPLRADDLRPTDLVRLYLVRQPLAGDAEAITLQCVPLGGLALEGEWHLLPPDGQGDTDVVGDVLGAQRAHDDYVLLSYTRPISGAVERVRVRFVPAADLSAVVLPSVTLTGIGGLRDLRGVLAEPIEFDCRARDPSFAGEGVYYPAPPRWEDGYPSARTK